MKKKNNRIKRKQKRTKMQIKKKIMKKKKKLLKKKKILEKRKQTIKKEKRENKAELETYEKCTHNLSLMLKSKTKKTGLKRYQKIIDSIDELPEKIRGFIKNIQKEIDKLHHK